MLVVTTPIIQGKKITEYKGPIFAQVVIGFSLFKSLSAGFRNIVGGRSTSHEEAAKQARMEVMREIVGIAQQKGANAIIGLTLDFEMISGTQNSNGLLMAKAFGTAVTVED